MCDSALVFAAFHQMEPASKSDAVMPPSLLRCQGTANKQRQGTSLLFIAGEKTACIGTLGHLLQKKKGDGRLFRRFYCTFLTAPALYAARPSRAAPTKYAPTEGKSRGAEGPFGRGVQRGRRPLWRLLYVSATAILSMDSRHLNRNSSMARLTAAA